jgi:hypothetical protein
MTTGLILPDVSGHLYGPANHRGTCAPLFWLSSGGPPIIFPRILVCWVGAAGLIAERDAEPESESTYEINSLSCSFKFRRSRLRFFLSRHKSKALRMLLKFEKMTAPDCNCLYEFNSRARCLRNRNFGLYEFNSRARAERKRPGSRTGREQQPSAREGRQELASECFPRLPIRSGRGRTPGARGCWR